MSDYANEQLLGHLLGALDDHDHEAVTTRLNHDREWQERWLQLRDRLERLEPLREDVEPPEGLARRTCRFVASQVYGEGVVRGDHADDVLEDQTASRHESGDVLVEKPGDAAALSLDSKHYRMSPEISPPNWIGRFRWLDVVMAASVFVIASLVTVSAVQQTRVNAAITSCQRNLFEVGRALAGYSDAHDGFFPRIPSEGNLAAAGAYAPLLLADGQLTDPDLFRCPGSDLFDDEEVHLPTIHEVRRATGGELAKLREWMGGDYGYHLGHMRDGVYYPTRNERRATFAVVSDAPSNLPGYQSGHHAGRGQNVLYEDGHVEFEATATPIPQQGSIFLNDDGVVAPGLHEYDSVIGASSTLPLIFVGK